MAEGVEDKWGVTDNKYGDFFSSDENVLECDGCTLYCKYNKNH